MRTDISEDSKGDPTKSVPAPPLPGDARPPGVVPLLPTPEPRRAPGDGGSADKQTEGDRRGDDDIPSSLR